MTREYQIRHECGHIRNHTLTADDAIGLNRQEALLRTTPCADCQETPPQASPAGETIAVSAAVAYNTERIPSSEAAHCTVCGRAMKSEHAMGTVTGKRVCPDCWHNENDGEGYGA